jgi:hypothetical protein
VRPQFGGADDPAFVAFGHRLHSIVGVLARLDLDENQNTAAAGDDVDFAEWRFPAPGKDAIGLGYQKQRCATFRRKPEAKCIDAFSPRCGFRRPHRLSAARHLFRLL